MMSYGQQQYKRTQVATVDRGRLIVLLYEGAISYLTKAKACLVDKDVAGASNLINRAQDIFDELNASLNMEQGGEIATNLRRLYLFMGDQLIKAKVKGDGEPLTDVIRMLTTLNEAWREAIAAPESQEVLQQKGAKVTEKAQTRASAQV